MNIKLDENLPRELKEVLTACGHNVQTVPDESLAGHPDETILAAATAEGRVLFTQDLDFSDLRRYKPGTHPGVVLLRLRDPSRCHILERIRQVLSTELIDAWHGCFVVISDRKLRIKRP